MSKKIAEVLPIRITYELDSGETHAMCNSKWEGVYITEQLLLSQHGSKLKSMTITKTFAVPVLEEAPEEVAGVASGE